MRIIVLLLIALTATGQVLAQAEAPVNWSYRLEATGEMQRVVAQAQIAPGWYVYGSMIEAGGPVPTQLSVDQQQGVVLVGQVGELGEARSGLDPVFEMQLTKYAEQVQFYQDVQLGDANDTVDGTLTFMTCNEAQCLPPRTLTFSVARRATP